VSQVEDESMIVGMKSVPLLYIKQDIVEQYHAFVFMEVTGSNLELETAIMTEMFHGFP
jgi:hypothetical protein